MIRASFLSLALLWPALSFSAILSSDAFTPLPDDPAGRQALARACENFGVLMVSAKERCRELAKESNFTPAVVTACTKDPTTAVGCLQAARDVNVPQNVLDLCLGVQAAKTSGNDVGGCLRYFRDTSSTFDEGAAGFCIRNAPLKNFREARLCLNAVRDRRIEIEDLKKCKDRGFRETLNEDFNACVDRVTAAAPLDTEAVCSGRARKAKPVESGGDGRPGRR